MKIMRGKKHMLRAIALMLAICSIAVMFTGCTSENSSNAYRTVNGSVIESQLIASNSNYQLYWDADGKAIVYKSVRDGQYWSDILYDSFLEGSQSANGNSPISITVANTKTMKWDTVTSYASLEEDGNILCKKIENGIRVTYFFEKYKIAIPVEYTLREDSLNVSVDSAKILEDGIDYKLISVSLTPLFCSVKNDSEDGQIFIPSGSGAIMNTNETPEGVRKFSGEVFGYDVARQVPYSLVDYEAVRLPVFGSSGNGFGILGIIEDGAGAAVIEAQAGNPKLNYSNVGSIFYLRGYDTFLYSRAGKPESLLKRANTNLTTEKFSVSYYPLYGDDANYNGMARKYREYLTNNGLLEKSEIPTTAYSVTFLGGTSITKSLLGIPYSAISSLTTFSQAEAIYKDLNQKIGSEPVVRMLGYGDNGINSGTIAGGKKYLSVYGSKKSLDSLLETTKGTRFYMDSDIVTYAKSGSGYSLNGDVARTAVMYKAEHFQFTPTRLPKKDIPYYIISRDNLLKVWNLALKKAKRYGNTGISLSTLGSLAYSDYNDNKYISKSKIDSDVTNIINNVQKEGYDVAVAEANSYAACAADMLFDIPIESANYSYFDENVPFYQMVFHSYKPMYSSAINLNENIDRAIAIAAVSGMGLGYTLTNNYEYESNDLDEFKVYGTVYDDNIGSMLETLKTKGYDDIYSKIYDAEFVSYKILDNGVYVSTFSNGNVVYANLTDSDVDSPIGLLKSYEFKIG